MRIPSITFWNRLEPNQRSSDYGLGLQAKVHDPLWMLARQWQIGEFEGEDAASPVKIDVDASFVKLNDFSSGLTGNAEPYDPDHIPLEVAVEKEQFEFSTLDIRLRAELGNEFLKFITTNNLRLPDRGILIDKTGFSDDEDLAKYPFVKKSIDAEKLMNLEVSQLSEAFGNPDAAVLQQVEDTLTMWIQWAEETIFGARHNSNWNPERQEYTFSVAAPGFNEDRPEIKLSVDQYPGGHLDWPDFTLESGLTPDSAGNFQPLAKPINLELIPMPVEIPGMPVQRWWEFEDSNVDFGKLETAPQDIARMLLAHFALISGNNWFSIPVELPVGSLTKVKSLHVTNTFGEVFDIQHSSADLTDSNAGSIFGIASPWRMFHISSNSGINEDSYEPFLFLPPALGPSLHSGHIEEVRFIRDEMANAAWLIEHIVQDKTSGGVINRHEKYHNLKQGFDRDISNNNENNDLKYTLTTDVPDYWFPLLHVQEEHGKPANKLFMGTLLRDPDQPISVHLGEISKELKDIGIFDEELPREGIFVYRQFQFARWYDGSSYLWFARRKTVGTGEGSNNLKFDSLV